MRYSLLLLPLALFLIGYAAYDPYVDSKIRQTLEHANAPVELGPGLHLVLCGTGTPQADEKHLPPCLAIVAGDQLLVFDAGEGTSRSLNLLGLHTREVDAVFITHWHSDHFGGLDMLINDSWIYGRKTALPVYGPRGVQQVLTGLAQAYSIDIGFRTAGRPDQLRAEQAATTAHEVEPTAHGELREIYRAGDVRVSAFLVEHEPVTPALGYRIDYAGQSIVISGDTKVSPHVAAAAAGADILVHEALCRALIDRALEVGKREGYTGQSQHIAEIIHYHADTLELAKLAERAGVKTLVLTHLIPSPPNWLAEKVFERGMSEHYHGRVVVGRDRLRITLPPKP
ncbi:MBL fold metallo-hydrolase [Archangium violaceum]|uniref:MBL fold metallo-hydrolase n=1 Tax=Archangium violaceum TaxID=83451 RepID=UPI00193C511A|nr:MBL fold metallo-hydrolase [Archangium violaceum]QRK06999.1 MBL fold metallo-hydrolase [Archangium violaceum]